jgi:preprotein translocase subunit SecE
MNISVILYGLLVVAAIVIFLILLRRGSFLRISEYCRETQEELKKCTWPTVDELKGSTVVVVISIILLGGFTVGVDFIVTMLVRTFIA